MRPSELFQAEDARHKYIYKNLYQNRMEFIFLNHISWLNKYRNSTLMDWSLKNTRQEAPLSHS